MNTLRIPAAALLALLTATSSACGKKDSPAPALVKGLGLSPAGFPADYTQLPAFFAEVGSLSHAGGLWNGAWRDDLFAGSDAGTAPLAATAVQQAAGSYAFTPLTVFGWRAGTTLLVKVPADSTNDWSNAVARAAYRDMLAAYATAWKPRFMFLGNENDFYAEQDAADYARWITAYDAAYDAIKAASPGTLVGPVFSHEHLAGRGALNGWTATHWNAIDAHDLGRIDVIGLTLYPWLQHATAAAVPADYLDAFVAHAGGKPIAVTETGWPAENLGTLNPTWETSPTAQVTYLSRLGALLHGKDVRVVTWLFLHPEVDPGGSPVEWKLFGSVSLRDGAGAERPVYAAWRTFAP